MTSQQRYLRSWEFMNSGFNIVLYNEYTLNFLPHPLKAAARFCSREGRYVIIKLMGLIQERGLRNFPTGILLEKKSQRLRFRLFSLSQMKR